MFQQVSSLALLAVFTAAAPAHAMQIRGTISGGRPSVPKTLVMIANPFAAAPQDSATVVAIGTAMRDKIEKSVGSDYRIITRKEMNDALGQFGYNADAILSPLSAGQLARQLGSRYYVTATFSKGAGGLSVTSRMIGSNLDVGQVVSATGTTASEVGSRLGEGISLAIKAITDAKACSDNAATKPAKAVESANKALKSVPNFGLAEYCLAEMAMKQDSVGAERLNHLKNAVKGDPLSLVAMSDISVIYQIQKDSAKVIEIYQQMLRAAPTNKALLESAFKVFVSYNKPDAAMAVADSGISMDQMNPDWYDLRSNVCFAKEDYGCAIAALENVYKVDSTRVDTLFFSKILFAASTKPDTAAYLRYGQLALRKYPDNAGLLEEAGKAYAMAGQADSTVALTKRLVAIDPSKTDAVLRVVQTLAQAGKPRETLQFAPSIKQYGDEDAKNNFASLMVNAAQPLSKEGSQDFPLMMELAQAALDVQPTNPQLVLYGNYFLGIGAFFQIPKLDASAREQKSCEIARQELALVEKAEPALKITSESTVASVATSSKGWLPTVGQARTSAEGLIKLYCK